MKRYAGEEIFSSEPGGNSIFHLLPIGIVTFNSELDIIDANRYAKALIKLEDSLDESLSRGMVDSESGRADWFARLKSVIASGDSSEFGPVDYLFNGRESFLRIFCSPVEDDVFGVFIEDVTEEVVLRRRLASERKLSAVGQHASRVAHELNSPLDGIIRYLNLALKALEQGKIEPTRQYLVRCRQGLMRIVNIVRDMLDFSRSSYRTYERSSVEKLIEEAVRTMELKAGAQEIKIERKYTSGMPEIRTDNLFQVFCNLIKNAFDAMPTGGELRITTEPAEGNNVLVEFRDTGTGFKPEQKELIFEPFYTTKEAEGTGLGLAICKDLVERYNGSIMAENAPGGGSIFRVYLPVRDD